MKQLINQAGNKKFWNFLSATDNQPPQLIIYGDISTESWWGDEVTPRQFSEELMALGNVPEIVVRINSGGGDVFAANAIYTRLKDNSAKIIVKIDGWAASAATIIAMAADTGCLEIPANGVFMVHDPKLMAYGYYGADDFVKLSEELKVVKQSIVNGYVLRTGKNEAEVSKIMEAESWYDGKQAVENGFCDKLMFEEVNTEIENASKVIVNSVAFDISEYKNIPISMLDRYSSKRNVGFTNIKNIMQKKESEKNMEIKTIDELKGQYPELVNQIVSETTAAERNRIKDIESIALAGFESIVNSAKFENPKSAGDVAKEIVAEQKKIGAAYISSRNDDAKGSGMNNVQAASIENPKGSIDENIYADAIDKLYPKMK